jgi:hypothetical protein
MKKGFDSAKEQAAAVITENIAAGIEREARG